MKKIPYLIISLVLLSLSENIFLLFNTKHIQRYFLWVNLATGACLIVIIFLSIYSNHRLKKQQRKYVHKIFSKT
jgi:hypothetical protein